PSARSKIFLQEFDQALETIDNFISGKPGLYFEALAGIELSKIYRQLPYYGFRRDGKIFYNQEDREGEYVYLWHENFDKSVELRESARLKLIAVIRDPGKCIAGTDDYRLTAIQNNLDLAELLMSTNNVYDGYPPAEDIVPPKQDETYLPEWHPRKKILFLFDEAVAFNSGRADKHVEAQSKFKKALFLMTFPESPSKEWLKETDELRKKYESDAAKDKPPFKQPVFAPSPDIDPLVIIESIIRDYPGDPDTDLYFGTIGRIFEARQDFVEAVAKYEEFLKKFPKSKYVPDVKLSLQGIKAPSMSFSAQTVTYKGQKPAIGINARNLSKIRFSLCEIDLEDLLLRSANLNDPTVSFTYFEKNFGKLKGAKNRCKKTIKKWTEEIEDAGDFQYLNKNSELQIGEIGAYLLHAEAENIEQVQLIIHTDVIAVGKQDRGKMHYILTDAKTGAPVGNFPVTMKEIYWQSGWWSHEKVRIKHDKTDEKGRVTFTFTTGDNIYSNRVEFFA
ncbi:MAG: hypothetical protein FJ088_12225, partial [Deltaproteobacteria bacterium]|nr:hypothetical protein [Deltaproteobacteria bacterium]